MSFAEVSEPQFHRVQVLKGDDCELGVGSYGVVYKAKCDDLLCAAKVLHKAFFCTNDPGSRNILRRFQQECSFLSRIRHPHIVQYLGMWRDSELQLPILLMELLDENLTKYLDRSSTPLSYHIQVNIAHDVAMALAFLHSKEIVHRDLSSNNVLLVAGQRAKVTDFGMSKLLDTQSVRRTLTHCPGTEVYMPPEALKDPPDYTKKIDCFSFGVLVIQIITKMFPDPGPRTCEVDDPQSPTGTADRPVLEEERRKTHISIIDRDHTLLPTVKECLKYRHPNRPTSTQLCTRLSQLKEQTPYKESSLTNRTDASKNIQFSWKASKCAPCSMASGSATAFGNVVYVQPWDSSKVFTFDSDSKSWKELPDVRKRECSLVVVQREVTAVGGCTDIEDFDTLTSLEVRPRGEKEWVVKLKNMPTKRYSAAAVSNEDVLIVGGGFANGRPLKCLEIMDIESGQWYTASSLPSTLHRHSAAICGKYVYMLGGKDPFGSTTSVFQSSLSLLLLRASTNACQTSSHDHTHSPWKKLASLPLSFTTSFSCHASAGCDFLVALGGYRSETKQRSSDIHVYNSASDSWIKAGTMLAPRSSCITCSLSCNTVVAVGGKNNLGLLSDTTEIGLF